MAEELLQITKQTENLLRIYTQEFETEGEKKVSKIQVSNLVSKLAFLYEKIRNVIDYKEEHLLRKNAIKRIVRRKLSPGIAAKKIAQPLIYELIQARYLENNTIPETKIQETTEIINKYILLMNQIFGKKEIEAREKGKMINWLLALCACEIEDRLHPHFKEEAMARYMYQVMDKSISWQEGMEQEDRDIQIYIAVHRALLKSDREIIAFRLFNLYYPKWKEADSEIIAAVAGNINSLYNTVENQIDHKLSSAVLRIVKKYVAPFFILEDVINANPGGAEETISLPKKFEEAITDVCNEQYKKRKALLRRASIRSIIYIFVTKVSLALLLEVPYDFYLLGMVNYVPLWFNILFHPILLFVIALSIRVPAEKNTQKIISSLEKIVYEGGGDVFHKIKPRARRHIVFSVLFNLFYLVTFGITFGLIIMVLRRLDFNLVSGLFFLMFLSIVSFFGIRNRERARELIVITEKEGVVSAIVDFFSIPILQAGRFISLNFSKINIFAFIFDFILEAPFKSLVEIIDDFAAFIKEKKEEITIR